MKNPSFSVLMQRASQAAHYFFRANPKATMHKVDFPQYHMVCYFWR